MIGILSAARHAVLPLLLGLLVRHRYPQLAERLLSPFELVSKILSLSAVALILGTQFRMLRRFGKRLRRHADLAGGQPVDRLVRGRAGKRHRKTMALTTSLRNVGVGLVIVTGNFAGTPAVSAALAYGIVEVLGSLLLALWWGRTTMRTKAPAKG